MKRFIVSLLLFAASVAAHAQPIATPDPVAAREGLWASENAFGPELRGELRLTRTQTGWVAEIGDVRLQAAALDFQFEDGSRFYAETPKAGRKSSGWWIQPPGLPGMAYATPVRLIPAGGASWRADIVPLDQTFTLFLRILTDDAGRWLGAFRNPEFNMNAGASRFYVREEAGKLIFSTPEGETVREAAVSGDGERLSLDYPPVPVAVQLTRTEAVPAAYPPRLDAPPPLQRPPRLKDGWKTARPDAAGFDEAALNALILDIAAADPAARRPQLIHSLLVARKGKLVLEEYFHGFGRDDPHDIRSAGKTTASILVGASMLRKEGLQPGTRIFDLLQPQGLSGARDPRKAEITLGHLMTHTSGLACDDNDDASPGHEGAMQGQGEEKSWWRFTMALPAAHTPGERYAYCSGGMNLVGAALAHVSGERVYELFHTRIARPMQFGLYHWNLMPDGEGYLGGGAYLRPRDLLKLGQLYLDGGVWNGRRIVGRDWARTSTQPKVDINEETTGRDAATFASTMTHGSDGYAWHRYPIHFAGREIEAFEANGNGGQFLIVVPEYDVVIVMTGGNYGQGGIWTRWRDEIAGGRILSAIRE